MISRITDDDITDDDQHDSLYVAVLTRLLPHGITDTMTLVMEPGDTVQYVFDWMKVNCQGGISFVRLELTEDCS